MAESAVIFCGTLSFDILFRYIRYGISPIHRNPQGTHANPTYSLHFVMSGGVLAGRFHVRFSFYKNRTFMYMLLPEIPYM